MKMPWEETDITTTDYAIGGKLIAVKVTVDESAMQLFNADPIAKQEMRVRLVMELAQEMLNKNLVEINQMRNHMDMSTAIVARAYVAPDSTVKLLRTLNR